MRGYLPASDRVIKEWCPVDVVAQRFDAGGHLLHAQAMGNWRRISSPSQTPDRYRAPPEASPVGARFLAGMLNADGFVLFAGRATKSSRWVSESSAETTPTVRGVLYIDRRAAVVLLNLHRSMRF